MTMVEKLGELSRGISIGSVNEILQNDFNVEIRSECEIFIKPEKKENKENLKNKIIEILKKEFNITENINMYFKFMKASNRVIIRLKRIERNSR